MTEPALVELANVGKTYANGTVALDGFRMTLSEGEFVSLLGPSGCGKSTVMRLIAGLSQPSAGAVRRTWDDEQKRAADRSHPVSCVFQEPTLLPWADLWENTYLPLRLQGESRAAAKSQVNDVLQLVGLASFAHAYPRELSGGMKMRAAVARALLTRPRLLMLDEPFAALDEITRSRLNDDLLTLWRQRRWAGLFITHSVFESVYLSTRVLVMSPRPGRIVDEIVVDLSAERTAETRTSSRYVELCAQVSRSLEQSAVEFAVELSHG